MSIGITFSLCIALLLMGDGVVVHGVDGRYVLVTELCVGFCEGDDCRRYETPLGACYSGQALFPNDPSWGDVDFLDHVDGDSLVRTLFRTNDGTCVDATDSWTLPLDECVGPFGKPRPWGKFTVASPDDAKEASF